jgi:hypothetical protein
MDLSDRYILPVYCLPFTLLKVDQRVRDEASMPSTCRTADPGGVQLASAGMCLVHCSVVIATGPLAFTVSDDSNTIPSLCNYLQGVVCLLQILLIVRPSHHIAETIHKPDLVLGPSLPHMFRLEVSVHGKRSTVLPAVATSVRQYLGRRKVGLTWQAGLLEHAHLSQVADMWGKTGPDLPSVAPENGGRSHST